MEVVTDDFWKFVESYRCRLCKVDLNRDNFGGLGENHMIGCSDCKNLYPEYFYRDNLLV